MDRLSYYDGIVLGQTFYRESPVRVFHPLTRFFITIGGISATILANGWGGFAPVAFVAFAYALASRVPLRVYVRSLSGPLLGLTITAVVLSVLQGVAGVESGQDHGIFLAARIILRGLVSFLFLSVFSVTTSALEFGWALELLFRRVGFLRHVLHRFVVVLSLCVAQLPILANSLSRILLMRRLRGASFDTADTEDMVITFIRVAVKRADLLATAMESRGFSVSTTRTNWKERRLRLFDVLIWVVIVLLFVVAVSAWFGYLAPPKDP